jgi:integrase
MAPEPKGGILAETLGDGTLAFRLRFRAYGKRRTVYLHERRDCDCGCRGGWNERTARVELDNILACVKAGVWQPPERQRAQPDAAADSEAPTFLLYTSGWLQAKIDGVLGERPLDASTESDYRWRLQCHLLPICATYRMDEFDRKLCLGVKTRLLANSKALREKIEAGAVVRDERGRRQIPLGASSIRKVIDLLAMILEDAVEDGYLDHNPARGKRMRVRVPKPNRTFLEIDELAALIDAASEQDISLAQIPAPGELGLTAAMVAQLFAQGKQPIQITRQLGLAKSTVNYHLSRLGLKAGRGYAGRRVVVEILGRSGVRASELCDMKIGHVRLHDPDGARFHIPDAKTDTGIREVQMSLELVEVIVEHLDRLRRIGAPAGPEDYLVPNLRGKRMDRQRVGEIVGEAAKRASERLTAKGMPPLPHTTPHTLRRTYISIALLANNFDVKWVMDQVGHADSKMTMDVYAQLQQRAKRDHGARFDTLLRQAQTQLRDFDETNAEGLIGTAIGTEGEKSPIRGSDSAMTSTRKSAPEQGKTGMARLGIEPRTPRFSGVPRYTPKPVSVQ